MCCMRHIQNLVYYRKFRYIQTYSLCVQKYRSYCGLVRTLCKSCIFRTLSYFRIPAYLEPEIYIQNSAKASSGMFRMLCNTRILTTCHIQNFATFRILTCLRLEAYSESRFFKYIHAYSIIIAITT